MKDLPVPELLSETLPLVSAQMRIELSGIHMALERLAPPEQRDTDTALDENAALLEQSYYRLLRLAKNLEQASLLGQQTPFPTENTDLLVRLDELVRRAAPMFALRDVSLSLQCKERHCVVAANGLRLEQAIWHLLSNALNATPSGGEVSVSLSVTPQNVLLQVTDTGRGIRPEMQERLFDGYLQAERPLTLSCGFGLGLPVARQIALLHGGQLLLDSRDGQGTSVTLVLPHRRTNETLGHPVTDYTGGFQPELVELSDALPSQAFLIRHLND